MKRANHRFAKATVLYCVAFASAASAWSLWRQGQGASMTDTLATVLAFFGGELLLLCLKTVLKKETKDDDNG